VKKILIILFALFITLQADLMQNVENFNKVFIDAKCGNSMSQFWLGNRYRYGNGTQVDTDKALYWYKKSASKGYIEAIILLSNLYIKGAQNNSTMQVGVHYLDDLAHYDKVFPNLYSLSNDYQTNYRLSAYRTLIRLYKVGTKYLKIDKQKVREYEQELQELKKEQSK